MYLNSGNTTKKLQLLHREIGNSLIKIKKKHPKSQSLVYSILDKLSKYYSFSKELITKKKEYKKLLRAELVHNESLKNDSLSMRSNIDKMRTIMLKAKDKIKKETTKVAELEEHKNLLSKEKVSFLEAKKKFAREKQKLIDEKDSITRERDALIRERDAVTKEKEILEKSIRPQVRLYR
jgi:hypothetical protein